MPRVDKQSEFQDPQLDIPIGTSKPEVVRLVKEFRATFDSMLRFLPTKSEEEVFLEEHIWRCLPNSRWDLAYLADCLTGVSVTNRSPQYIVVSLIYSKLAALVCEENPWRFSRRTLLRSEEMQQLWIFWSSKLTREIRLSFSPKVSPGDISSFLVNFDKLNVKLFKLKFAWVISRHEKKGESGSREMTEWHAHGIFWPADGCGIHKTTFDRRISKLKDYVFAKLALESFKGFRIERIGNFPGYINYLGKNLDEGNRNRSQEERGARLYRAPKYLSECAGKKVEWEKATKPARPSEFYKAYHQELNKIAIAKGYEPDDQRLKFTKKESAQIYQKLRGLPSIDNPRRSFIRGLDGHSYRVVGYPPPHSGMPIYFILFREPQLTKSGEQIKSEMDGAGFECSLIQLMKLSQKNITQRCPINNDIDPVFGKPYGRDNENFLSTIVRSKHIDQLEYETWKKMHQIRRNLR